MIKTADLLPYLSPHLSAQRWYAGESGVSVRVVEQRELRADLPSLTWMLVEADGATYQLLLGARAASDDLAFLHGSDGLVALVGDVAVYDAVYDPGLGDAILSAVTDGSESSAHVRPVGAEQSNTSLVFDERLILKLFRRLQPGANPDIEIPSALAAAGFDSVPKPVAVWREGDLDLAVVQPFLAGSTEGWALALTSLRDFYAAEFVSPAECGGDFAPEARRLGEITAGMHLALGRALGTRSAEPSRWADDMVVHLDRVARTEPWADAVKQAILAAVGPGGSSIRVHGDLHLGQVLRADAGWYVLDFEGEPARSLEERSAFTSPLKDVAGMVRSFSYAAHVALNDRGEDERKALEAKADLWERHNREAYLRGYFSTAGVLDLLPEAEGDRMAQLTAWELDKAVYELGYERAYRPAWEVIPLAAIEGLLKRGRSTT